MNWESRLKILMKNFSTWKLSFWVVLFVAVLPGISSGKQYKTLRLAIFPPETEIRAFFEGGPPGGDLLPNGSEVTLPGDVLVFHVRMSAPGFETKESQIKLLAENAVGEDSWLVTDSLRPDSVSAVLRAQWHHRPLLLVLLLVGGLGFLAGGVRLVRSRILHGGAAAEEARLTALAEVEKLKQKLHEGSFELEDEQIDGYRIERLLGEGGYSRVYLARQGEELVALKLLKQDVTDEEMLGRMRREIEIGRKLCHPNIVRMFAFGTFRGSPYIVTEFLPGRPLDSVLKEERLPLQRVVQIGEQIVLGLEYAHSHKVIHRDLKPGNLFLTEDGQIKILDFGMAQILESDEKLTQTGESLGTPTYMSPEQIRGKTVFESDYYSFGVILFELLTGELPFWGRSAIEVLSAHSFESPPKAHETAEGVPLELSELIDKLLEKRPENRMVDASEIVRILSGYKG